MSRSRTAALLLTSCLLTACGSTVQQTGTGAVSPGLGDGTSVGLSEGTASAPSTTSSSGAGSQDLSTVGVGSGGSTGVTPGGGTADGGASSSTGAAVAPIAPKGREPLKVGIPYLDQAQSNAFLSGISAGLETGDAKTNFTIYIDDLNRKGGILGRKVVPVFHKVDFTKAQAYYEQEICTDFTQDRRVPFVLGGLGESLAKCLIDRGVAVLGEGSQVNTSDYERMRYFVQPGSFSLDRLARLQATEFPRMGLFSGKLPAKVGVLFYETATFAAAEKVLVAGLRKQGVNVAAEEAFHQAGSTQDLGRTEAQVQSAVLKFKTLGITHVIAVELNAWLQGFFALYGSQQDYYPRYGWTSNQVPTNAQAAVPHRALENSLVIGFYPTYDTEKLSDYPAETLRCIKVLTSNGVSITTGNQRSEAVGACDAVRYLKAALTAGRGLDRDALVRGAKALKRSWVPAATYASFLPKGYGAGAAAIRPAAWSTACDCFTYTGTSRLVD